MDFFEVLEKRHSTRSFKEKMVEEEKLIKLLKAINSAPSAGNIQSYKIFIARKQELKEKLSSAALSQTAILQAPVVLVFCADTKASASKYGSKGELLYCIQDASIAAAYCQLAATALGLSTVWIGAFNEKETGKVFGIPGHLKPIALIPLGYASGTLFKSRRKKIEEIVEEK